MTFDMTKWMIKGILNDMMDNEINNGTNMGETGAPDGNRIETELVRRTQLELGVELEICLTRETADPGDLSQGERERYYVLKNEKRILDWLKGRMALKSVLRRLGKDEDTSRLIFPHPRLSLSHSGGMAVAVGSRQAISTGLGVDYEYFRPVRPEMDRHFLCPWELEYLATHPIAETERGPDSAAGGNSTLLRLWTIKEAIFKADSGNRERLLKDYRLLMPLEFKGIACLARQWDGGDVDRVKTADAQYVPQFRYMSLILEEGILSIALHDNRKNP